jgi:hypothetical protein
MATFRDTRTGQLIEAHSRARTIYFRQQSRYEEVGDHTEVEEVPDGTVAEVLDWAGDDPDRRAAALDAERNGKQRKTVLEALS